MAAPVRICIEFAFDGMGDCMFIAKVLNNNSGELARGTSSKNAAAAIDIAMGDLAWQRDSLPPDDLAFAMGILTKMHRTVSAAHGGVS